LIVCGIDEVGLAPSIWVLDAQLTSSATVTAANNSRMVKANPFATLRIDLIACFLKDGSCGASTRMKGAHSSPGTALAATHRAGRALGNLE